MTHQHSHDHGDHHHDHHHAPANFNNAFFLAVILNLAFTVIEAIYAYAAHSTSLLADAGHNLGDVFSLLMAWDANILMQRAATEKYSYGYKKMTLLAALANALLLVLASAVVIFESINKLLHPVAVNEIIVIVVALIGMAINGGTALMFLRGQEHDLNIKAAYLHLAADALISISVAATGAIILFTNWWWLRSCSGNSDCVSHHAQFVGFVRGSVDLLLGAVPHGVNHQQVRGHLTTLSGVESSA